MGADEIDEARETVAQRVEFLELLEESGELETRDIVERLDHSRSTVTRALRELGDAGLIEKSEAGYRATAPGSMAASAYRRYETTTDAVLSSTEILEPIPDQHVPPATLLREADVHLAEDAAPFRPLQIVTDRVRGAASIRAFLPTLFNPQLLTVWHDRIEAERIESTAVFDRDLLSVLKGQYPDLLSGMARARCFSATVSDGPPYSIVLTTADDTTTVSIVVYEGDTGVRGVITTDADDATDWAMAELAQLRQTGATVTDELASLAGAVEDGVPELRSTASTGSESGDRDGAGAGHSLPIDVAADGFVRLSADYFESQEQALPRVSWRTGLTLPEVRAGQAVERVDDTGRNLVDELTGALAAGDDTVVLGPPGAGKSTLCMAVACQWYERGRGPVLYRERGQGDEFQSGALLEAYLRQTCGHSLVVVEDAVRGESNGIFEVMRSLDGREDVTFLLDSRAEEWRNPDEFALDRRQDAYRRKAIDRVTLSGLDEADCGRFVTHLEELTGTETGVTGAELFATLDEGGEAATKHGSKPGEVLLVQHHLSRRLESETADRVGRTELEGDARRSYRTLLESDEPLAADVAVLVNLLNAAGVPVAEEFLYSLAPADEFGDLEAAISLLEGRVVFSNAGSGGHSSAFRTHHESWATRFLEQMTDVVGTHRASETFGSVVSGFLSLADDTKRRERIKRHLGRVPHLHRIESDPTGWADEVVERLFRLGVNHSSLAPLYGDSDVSIDLPSAASPRRRYEQRYWRAKMRRKQTDFDRALSELDGVLESDQFHEEVDGRPATELAMKANWEAGVLHLHVGNLKTATKRYRESAELADALDDVQGRASARCGLGEVEYARNNFSEARDHFERVLETARSNDIPKIHARASRGLASLEHTRGNYDAGHELDSEALTIAERSGNVRMQGAALLNLGYLALRRGELAAADRRFADARDVSLEYGYAFGVENAALNSAHLSQWRGDLDQAEARVREVLDSVERSGDQSTQSLYLGCVNRLSRVAFDRGKLDEAEDYASDLLSTSTTRRTTKLRSLANRTMARIALRRGNGNTCEHHLGESRTLGNATGNQETLAQCELIRSGLEYRRGNLAEATERVRRALETFRQLRFPNEIARCRRLLCLIALERGEPEAAEDHLSTGLRKAKESGVVRTVALLHLAGGQVADRRGNPEAARRHRTEARTILETVGDERLIHSRESTVP